MRAFVLPVITKGEEMVSTKVTSAKDKEYVLRMAKEAHVKFIRLWFTDILGFLKSFAITVEGLEEALEEGVTFDGSSIEGFARIDESDMIAMPDPNTFCLLPWRPRENAVARMFCDIVTPGGKPYEGDPRNVLRRNLMRAVQMEYTYYVGTELEYFYLKNQKDPAEVSQPFQPPQPIDQGGYFDLTPLDIATDLRRDTVLTLEAMGIGVESSHHEVAASQHEIDLRYTDALTMADNTMTFRLVVKEIALKHGVYATFMPKPFADKNGNGMHVNQSLFSLGQGSRNTFFDAKDKSHLSKTARHFIAGLLRHAPEFCLVTNQWINSYKRLVPGFEAPVYLSWAFKNRSDFIRIPAYQAGKEDTVRIELRSPDSACNPYLAFSVMLAAGLDGIEKEYNLVEPTKENVHQLGEEERRHRGIQTLPDSFDDAIELCQASPFVRGTLGEPIFQSFIENKKIEWARYRSQVTDYEIREYLPLL